MKDMHESTYDHYKDEIMEKVLEIGPGNYPDPRSTISIDNFCMEQDNTPAKADLFMDVNKGLNFPDNHFDGVLMFEVIEHVDNPSMVLREVYRVLKPGGYLEMFTPQPYWWYKILCQTARGIVIPYPDHLYLWSQWEFTRLIEKSGFAVESIKIFNVHPIDNWNKFWFGLDTIICKTFPQLSRNIFVRSKKENDNGS